MSDIVSAIKVTSAAAPPPRSKSKKKKGGAGGNGQGENTGRWTAEEHRLFLQGLEQHGKGWKKIASLIKSRTVVQIRTHAQKYFQKLAKARQNGEEGEVTMEGRGGLSTTASITAPPPVKRRRVPLAGTKRKAIASVVHSAHKQAKKLGAPLPAVAPALANFVVPVRDKNGFAGQGNLPASVLEDSIFRFLTPAPVATTDAPVLNEVARQAGANPITVPSDNPSAAPTNDSGEVSPTGVADISIYPTWTDTKDAPSWYAKGADVDALLDVAGSLDWLVDSGDPNEHFQPSNTMDTSGIPELDVSPSKVKAASETYGEDPNFEGQLATISSSAELPQTMDDSNMEQVVPPLPSFFGGGTESDGHFEGHADETHDSIEATTVEASPSTMNLLLSSSPSAAKLSLKEEDSGTPADLGDASLFHDSEMEHDFVSTILQNSESAVDLAALND